MPSRKIEGAADLANVEGKQLKSPPRTNGSADEFK
jgi:hypothetical protein